MMEKVLFYNKFITRIMNIRHSFDNILSNYPITYENENEKKPEIDMVALKMGNHEVFEKVFHKYYSKVKKFLEILTKSKDMADELSQQVFVNLWTYHKSIDPRQNFDAYIYTITRNIAMNALKKQIKDEVDIYDYPYLEYETYPDAELIAKETEMLVKMAVNMMPPKRKLVYNMSRQEYKTNDEISKELDISRKMVEKHLRDSLADIKQVLRIALIFFV